jgi:hypothetical protein
MTTKPPWFDAWFDRLNERFPAEASRRSYVAAHVALSSCVDGDTVSIAEIAGRIRCKPADVIDAFDDLAGAGLLAAVVASDGDTALVEPLHGELRPLC